MTVNSANFLQFIPKDGGDSNKSSAAGQQFAQQTWAAGGVFVDANSTDEQKLQAATSTVTSLLQLFGANEAGAASQEVGENERTANELNQSIKTTTDNTNAIVNEQIEKIKEIANKIQETLDKVEKENEEKQEHQKQLQEFLETIDNNKAILESADINTPEGKQQRKDALNNLRQASEGINKLSEAIKTLQTSTEKESEEVEDLGTEQTDVDTNIETAIQDGNSQLEATTSRIAAEQTKNTATATKGTANEATSVAAKTAAETTRAAAKGSSWIPFAGGAAQAAAEILAQKYDSISNDFGQAGGVFRIPGAAKTMANLSASELTRQSSLTMFADLSSYALGESDGAKAISQSFYSILEPIGQWLEEAEGTEAQAEKLNGAVETVAEQIEEQPTEEQNPDSETESDAQPQDKQGVTLEFETDELQELTK